MNDLKAFLSQLGLENITTYLQTGNVGFESPKPITELKPMIEAALTEQFHYDAHVLIFPAVAVSDVVRGYPFAADDIHHRYAIFCSSQAVSDELMAHKPELDAAVEDIAAGVHVLYWRVLKGSTTESAFGKILARPRYKATTTNRNINTLEKFVANLVRLA